MFLRSKFVRRVRRVILKESVKRQCVSRVCLESVLGGKVSGKECQKAVYYKGMLGGYVRMVCYKEEYRK